MSLRLPGQTRWAKCAAAVLLLVLAGASWAIPQRHESPEYEAAIGRIQDAGRFPSNPPMRFLKELQRAPVNGDLAALQLALAQHELADPLGSDRQQTVKLLMAHASRLHVERLLGRPVTRLQDVAAVVAFERAQEASLALLRAEVFGKVVQVQVPSLQTGAAPDPQLLWDQLGVLLRHLPLQDAEVSGTFLIRIADPQAIEGYWRRFCRVLPATVAGVWTQVGDGVRSAREACSSSGDPAETPEDGLRALQRVRSGAAAVEIVPTQLHVLPSRFEDRLPFGAAADRFLAAGCRSTGNCRGVWDVFLRRLGAGNLVLAFLLLQGAIVAALLWASRRGASKASAGRSSRAALAYLTLVVLAHAGAVGTALNAGSLVLFFAWYFLGLPLFGPGFVVGLIAIFSGLGNKDMRRTQVALGVFAVSAPVLEWMLAGGVLKSGYAGG